jgi:serine/threonine-protein kinase HipA
MKKLQVIYRGWGEHWPLGTLADTGREVLFEYSSEAIQRGLQLSPMHHQLPNRGASTVTFRGEAHFYGLPGFIADSLPDGWGLLLMDRALRRLGRNPQETSILERLAIIGDRALGALAFEPAEEGSLPAEVLHLKELAQEVQALVANSNEKKSDEITHLRHLMQLGGSPQGARPKVLLDFDMTTGLMSSGTLQTASATPWLFKFPAKGEHKEVCALEELYARLARKMGIEMPLSRFFDLGGSGSAFGVERFDRVVRNANIVRVPTMSLSAYLQSNFRIPSLDYETFLLATLRVTGDQREVIKAFERCVFNVMLHNRDDHGRNFAFRLNEQGLWKLAPAFDLTYSFGPGGEHSTTVAGYGKNISRTNLLQVAKVVGITLAIANTVIDQAMEAISQSMQIAGDLPIRKITMKTIQALFSKSSG